jgi:hypothetical protein
VFEGGSIGNRHFLVKRLIRLLLLVGRCFFIGRLVRSGAHLNVSCESTQGVNIEV